MRTLIRLGDRVSECSQLHLVAMDHRMDARVGFSWGIYIYRERESREAESERDAAQRRITKETKEGAGRGPEARGAP